MRHHHSDRGQYRPWPRPHHRGRGGKLDRFLDVARERLDQADIDRLWAQGRVLDSDAAVTLAGDSALAGYHLFPSVRGDLLMKMGRLSEARHEIERAIAMTKNVREQELLANKLKQLEKSICHRK